MPDDAINQMHRYRDALLYQQQDDPIPSRPTFGAFALYPGFMSQQPGTKNPYQEEIDRIGIGAFALLPAEDHSGSCWLQTFLEQKLGKSGKSSAIQPSARATSIWKSPAGLPPWGCSKSATMISP